MCEKAKESEANLLRELPTPLILAVSRISSPLAKMVEGVLKMKSPRSIGYSAIFINWWQLACTRVSCVHPFNLESTSFLHVMYSHELLLFVL